MNKMTRIVAAQPESYRARFTVAEFERMCEADAFGDMKVELVGGEIERLNLPKNEHSRLQSLVMAGLLKALGDKGVERVRGDVGIVMDCETVLGGDATLLAHPVTERRWLRPEEVTLIVEIADTTVARDLGMKQPRYAAASIPFYWVVNSSARVTHIFAQPSGGSYQVVDLVRFGESLAVPGTDATITLS